MNLPEVGKKVISLLNRSLITDEGKALLFITINCEVTLTGNKTEDNNGLLDKFIVEALVIAVKDTDGNIGFEVIIIVLVTEDNAGNKIDVKLALL
jgi:hypothetical protein